MGTMLRATNTTIRRRLGALRQVWRLLPGDPLTSAWRVVVSHLRADDPLLRNPFRNLIDDSHVSDFAWGKFVLAIGRPRLLGWAFKSDRDERVRWIIFRWAHRHALDRTQPRSMRVAQVNASTTVFGTSYGERELTQHWRDHKNGPSAGGMQAPLPPQCFGEYKPNDPLAEAAADFARQEFAGITIKPAAHVLWSTFDVVAPSGDPFAFASGAPDASTEIQDRLGLPHFPRVLLRYSADPQQPPLVPTVMEAYVWKPDTWNLQFRVAESPHGSTAPYGRTWPMKQARDKGRPEVVHRPVEGGRLVSGFERIR